MRGIRPLGLILAVAVLVVSAMLTGCAKTAQMAPPMRTAVPFVGTQVQTPSSAPAKSPGGTAAAGHTIVEITATGFQPSAVSVKAGARVVWENKDSVAHSLTIQGGPKSAQIAPGATATHLFTKAGTFQVSDTAFTVLNGTVTVSK